MKITAARVILELEKNYGWKNLNITDRDWFMIRDTLKIVDEQLKKIKEFQLNNSKISKLIINFNL